MSLKKLSHSSISLLQLLAFLNPDEILLEFLLSAKEGLTMELRSLLDNNVRLRESLQSLRGFSLVRVWGDRNKVSMHRLLQATIQDGFDDRIRSELMTSVIRMVLYGFPDMQVDRAKHLQVCRRY